MGRKFNCFSVEYEGGAHRSSSIEGPPHSMYLGSCRGGGVGKGGGGAEGASLVTHATMHRIH